MIENRWLVLAVLFVARAAMACQFQSVGSLGPVLVQSRGIDYARAPSALYWSDSH
jgi:hypothetical protein